MSDQPEQSENFEKNFNPQPLPWHNFEEEVAVYIEKEVREGSIPIPASAAKVRRKPAYYSKDRESHIIFDVSIEVRRSPSDDSPFLIWIWECKDYPTHNVTVEEVEEFHSKLRQIGAHKGTMVTRSGFQKGAITLAKTHRIGLMVLNKQRTFALALSQDAGIVPIDQIYASYALYPFGLEVHGPELSVLMSFEIKQGGVTE